MLISVTITVDPFPTILLNLKFLQEGETMALIDVPVDIRRLVTAKSKSGQEGCVPSVLCPYRRTQKCGWRAMSPYRLWYVDLLVLSRQKKEPGISVEKMARGRHLLKKAEQNKMCGQWKIMHNLIAHTRCQSCWLVWLFLQVQ